MRSSICSPCLLVFLACACSAENDSAVSDSERVWLETELARVGQSLGEASCGTVDADETWDGNGTTGSDDASYGQPGCTDGYVIDAPDLAAGLRLRGGPPPQAWPDPFTCLFHWGYLSVFQKQGDSYVKISEAATLGQWRTLPRAGSFCDAGAIVTIPEAGDYRLVTAAGFLFGQKQVVHVYRP